jgi:hypothetical protein
MCSLQKSDDEGHHPELQKLWHHKWRELDEQSNNIWLSQAMSVKYNREQLHEPCSFRELATRSQVDKRFTERLSESRIGVAGNKNKLNELLGFIQIKTYSKRFKTSSKLASSRMMR